MVEKVAQSVKKDEDVGNFVVSAATTMGASHKNAHGPGGINNQDAVSIIYDAKNHPIGGVVCDGCGSMKNSEVGAKAGAKIISKIVSKHASKKDINWKKVTDEAVAEIKEVAKYYAQSMDEYDKVIQDYFLFTVLIAVAHNDKIIIATCGDGTFLIDDDHWYVTTPIDNAPPYLAYNIIPSKYDGQYEARKKIIVVDEVKITDMKKGVIIGSDGLYTLIETNKSEMHHPIFADSSKLQLFLQGQVYSHNEVTLNDDVSMIVIRTKELQESLFEERNQIGELLNKVDSLEKQLSNKISIINEQTSEIAQLESDLKIARANQFSIFPSWNQGGKKKTKKGTNAYRPSSYGGAGKVYTPPKKTYTVPITSTPTSTPVSTVPANKNVVVPTKDNKKVKKLH